MAANMHENVQIARGGAARASFAFIRDADAGAVIHSRWHLDVERTLAVDPAFAPAGGAGIADHFAPAVTGGTCALDDKEALLRANLAMAGTGGTALGAGARLCPRSFAGIADHSDIERDRRFLTRISFFERNLEIIT